MRDIADISGDVPNRAPSRERDLEGRLRNWTERIGEQATITTVRSYWYYQIGYSAAVGWVVIALAFEFTNLSAGLASATVVAWPIMMWSFVKSVKLIAAAQRQAGAFAGTSEKARPPVKRLALFDRWAKENEFSRFKVTT